MRRESHSRLKFLLESIQELDLEFRREEIRVEMGRGETYIYYLMWNMMSYLSEMV